MLKLKLLALAAACAAMGVCAAPAAAALTIHDIQYTTDPAGNSPYNAQIVDCTGGIVTHKFPGSKPKLTLQDPSYPDGWGAIQVKDWTTSFDLYSAVSVGDWVSLTNMEVEESYGNTLLHFKSGNSAGWTILSSGSALPAHRLVSLAEIAAPLEGPPEEWYVADHSAEKYEAMLLTVQGVSVSAKDLGAKRDNYSLHAAAGDCWAADYMNVDRVDLYHPYVYVGAAFDSVSGILEQYTKNEFDYYQLLTTCTADLVPEPLTLLWLLAGTGGVVLGKRGRMCK